MNLALLMLLALLWSVVLLPSALRNRRRSLHHSMGGFAHAMHVLSGSDRPRGARPVLVPANAARIVSPPTGSQLARERRRRALVVLGWSAAVTTLLSIVAGGLFTLLAVAADLALVAYVAALRNLAVQSRRRAELVRLDQRRQAGGHGADIERRAVGI